MATLRTESPTNRALLSALALWAGAEQPALLLRLGHQRARQLLEMRRPLSAEEALEQLRTAHKAQMLPDLSRVHFTWLVRALKDESGAVQRIVAASQDEPLRSRLLNACHLDRNALKTDYAPKPFAMNAVLSLWTERLVGDIPPHAGDAPIVQAVTTLHPVSLCRLARLTGLCKLSRLDANLPSLRTRNRDRLAWFASQLAEPEDLRVLKVARHDRQLTQTSKQNSLEMLGVFTWSRLLAQVDDYRLRWALQHIPYPVVKRIRGLAAQPQSKVRAVIAWENQVFEVARRRFDLEIRGDRP